MIKKILLAVVVLVGVGALFFTKFRSDLPNKPVEQVAKSSYIALGDSVAAGFGLQTSSDISACDRTREGYPFVFASSTFNLHDFACSGATISLGLVGPQDVNKLSVAPQLEQLFEVASPEVVSLTIGANDVGWSQFLAKCYTAVCGDALDTQLFAQKTSDMAAQLSAALSKIDTHYSTVHPKTIVLGYYQVFPASPAKGCTGLNGMDQSELDWTRQREIDLNKAIAAATKGHPRTVYRDVDFAGHEICSAASWVQDFSSKGSFHPTDLGQKEYAKQAMTALDSIK